jgi:hypothetical protein
MAYPGAEDMAKVQQALANLRVDERNPPSLAGLIGDWNELVAQVEAGYDWSIDEYWSDLACRDQLSRGFSNPHLPWPTGSIRSYRSRMTASARRQGSPAARSGRPGGS